MKRFLFLIPTVILIALVIFLFREPIIDFLPIDQSGWSVNEQGSSYLDEDGDPVSGWYEVEGVTYYFNPVTYTLHTGWLEEGSARCYLVDGLTVSGWTETPDGRYFLEEDGTIHTGWLEDGGKDIYLGQNGFPATGWTETDKGLFYLDSTGAPSTGLVETDKGIYCFNEDGTVYSGWYEQEDKRYFANEDGSLHLGWLEQDGSTYYMKEDGSAAKGKLVIDEQTCFFNSKGAQFILVNPWNELPEGYVPELEMYEGAYGSPVCKEDLQQMFADCRAEGLYIHIMSGYRSVWDQTVNFENAVRQRMNNGYGRPYAEEVVRQIIARPGTSEHHLGLAFDIVDSRRPSLDYRQELMDGQKWLMEHSWEYGFILRYPNGTTDITGIIYEPWHYRYVGREMAAEIHELGITLEEYVDMLTGDGTTCGGTPSAETEEE